MNGIRNHNWEIWEMRSIFSSISLKENTESEWFLWLSVTLPIFEQVHSSNSSKIYQFGHVWAPRFKHRDVRENMDSLSQNKSLQSDTRPLWGLICCNDRLTVHLCPVYFIDTYKIRFWTVVYVGIISHFVSVSQWEGPGVEVSASDPSAGVLLCWRRNNSVEHGNNTRRGTWHKCPYMS